MFLLQKPTGVVLAVPQTCTSLGQPAAAVTMYVCAHLCSYALMTKGQFHVSSRLLSP